MRGTYLREGSDGRRRCWWSVSADDYPAYHDTEWGRPTADDRVLFEKLCLESFQSGLSWLTILRKRDDFRRAFANFDAATVAAYGVDDVQRLMSDAGIVRNRRKIESTIANAASALELVDEFGSFAAYVWSFEPETPHRPPGGDSPIPSTSPASVALSGDLKKRGWSFIGPTTAYAFMQAMGLTNDHVEGCAVYEEVEAERRAFIRPRAPS